MSYRKITVDGKEYEYVIGRTHVKVKTVGLFKVSEVGNNIAGTNKYVITPPVIAAIIRKQPVPLTFHCKAHNTSTTQLTYDPYIIAARDKKGHMPDCPGCYENAYMES